MKKIILSMILVGASMWLTATERMVVYPAKPLPVEKFAAEELATYLSKSTGQPHRAVTENTAKATNAKLFVGRCNALKKQPFFDDQLANEEFIITLKDGKLYICGSDGPGRPLSGTTNGGTLLGVYDFLEKELGIAWLWPGPDGEDIPSIEWGSLKDFSRRSAPACAIRGMQLSYMKYEPKAIANELTLWCRRQKIGWGARAWFGHSWDYYVRRTGIVKTHPEWLALYGGERRMPHCCTSNPEFRDYIVEQVFSYPINKNKDIVSISPSDGYGFCECENCRKLDKPGTDYDHGVPNLSERHWDYANYIAREVKKRDPKRGVGMFAYTAYSEAPDNIDTFEDNLYVSMTFSKAYFVKPDIKKRFFERLAKWQTKGVKIVGREYWGMHYWLSLPYVFTQQIGESMPLLFKAGLVGMYGEIQKDFSTQGPNLFLVSQMMWDPSANPQKILTRYYQGFGPAESAIRAYFDTFEQAILDHQSAIPNYSYRQLIYSWPEVFDVATLKQAGESLDQARQSVSNADGIYRRRVEFIGVGYEYTLIMMKLLTLYRRLGQAGVPLTAFSLAGDQIEADKYKIPSLPGVVIELWKSRPEKPLPKEEKIAMLKQAIEFGEARAQILQDNAENAAVSLGMYQFTIDRGIRPWHQTCIDELARLTESR